MARAAGTNTFGENNSKFPHSLFIQTPVNSPEFIKPSFTNPEVSRNGQSYKRNDTNEGIGACSSQSKLRVPNFSDTQEGRVLSPNIQPQKFKQVHFCETIQTYKHAQNFEFLTTPGLVNKNRFIKCLFPSSGFKNTQTLSSSYLRSKTLSNDLFTFWPSMRTKDFRFLNKLGCTNFTREKSTSCGVFGRFFVGQSGPYLPLETSSRSNSDSGAPGLANKLCKVGLSATKGSSISGHCLASTLKHKKSSRSEMSRHLYKAVDPSQEPKGKPTRDSKHNRNGKFCQLSSPSRTLEPPSSSQVLPLFTNEKSSETLPNSCNSTKRTSLVESKPQKELADSLSPCIQLSSHRCLECCLGCPAKRCDAFRCMELGGKESTFQSSRNVSGLARPKRSGSAPGRIVTDDAERQPDSCCLLKKRRRDKVNSPYGLDLSNFDFDRSFQDPPGNTLPTRSVQWRGGSTVAALSSTRMASCSPNYESDLRQIWHTCNRPICVSSSTRGAGLRHIGPEGSGSLSLQRFQPDLELSPGLGISTSLPDATCTPTSEQRDGVVLGSRSTMAQSVLEVRSKKSCPGPAIYDSQIESIPDRYDVRTSTSNGLGHDPRGLEVWGWEESLVGWSQNQKDLLRRSWRESSLKTYKPIWQRWRIWANENNVVCYKPTGSDLARFLIDMYQNYKLSYNTILVYKSAVSTLCDPNSDIRLSSHLLVRHALKSISIATTKPKKTPVWDVDVLVDWLKAHSPDINSLYECSGHTAILLLLSSGRRVHDLTLLAVGKEQCIFMENFVIFWPKYGSKTDTATNRQSGWRISKNKDNLTLDPLFWIQRLIDLSRLRRSACGADNLFLTTCGKPKAASSTNIAGWVKKILLRAGINASPGSVRSAVASKNWVQNCPLDEILARGNWRSENTFLKFYCKEINPSPKESNSMCSVFTPVNE